MYKYIEVNLSGKTYSYVLKEDSNEYKALQWTASINRQATQQEIDKYLPLQEKEANEKAIKDKASNGQLSLLISTFNDIVISYADSSGYNLTGVEALKNHIRENQIILFKAQLALKLIKPNAVISEVYTNAMISILAEMKTNLTPLYDSLAELLGIVEVIEPADLIAEWDKLHIAIHN